TGGSKGIGLACAKAYATAGAQVAIVAPIDGGVDEAMDQLGGSHLGIVGDVSNEKDVARAIQLIMSRYGKLDAVHNNAGVATPSKPLHETTDSEWRHLMNVNLRSILFTTRYAI